MMEARRSFQGSANSRHIAAAVVALLAALVLVVIGGLIVKTLSAPAAAPASHSAAGQPDASGYGSAWNYVIRRSGTQSVEGPASTAPSTGSTFHAPGSRLGGGRQI